MTTDRWQRLQQLFGKAMAQPTADRADWVRRACEGDEALRAELLTLLSRAGDTDLVADAIRGAARDALGDEDPGAAAARALRRRMVDGARTGTTHTHALGRVELLALDAALDRLATHDAALAARLERSVFGTPAPDEADEGRDRQLAFARAWVYRQMDPATTTAEQPPVSTD